MMKFGAPPRGPIPAWSFSRLKEFEDCPARCYARQVEKRGNFSSDASDRGSLIHDELEKYVKGENDENDFSEREPFENHRTYIERLRLEHAKGKVQAEEDWAFDIDWADTGWFDDDVWFRFKLDVMLWHDNESATAIDWKTGKGSDYAKFKYLDQMKTYAIAVFMKFEKLQFVVTNLVFVDKEIQPLEQRYSREQAMKVLPRLNERAINLTSATEFPATPGKYTCKFCPFGNEEVGDKSCKFRYQE